MLNADQSPPADESVDRTSLTASGIAQRLYSSLGDLRRNTPYVINHIAGARLVRHGPVPGDCTPDSVANIMTPGSVRLLHQDHPASYRMGFCSIGLHGNTTVSCHPPRRYVRPVRRPTKYPGLRIYEISYPYPYDHMPFHRRLSCVHVATKFTQSTAGTRASVPKDQDTDIALLKLLHNR